jgi:bifunctional DNase/RNase
VITFYQDGSVQITGEALHLVVPGTGTIILIAGRTEFDAEGKCDASRPERRRPRLFRAQLMAYLEPSTDSKRFVSGAREPRLRVNGGVLGRRPGVDRASTGTRQARIAPASFGAQGKELPMVAVKVEDVVVRVAADDPSRILMETPTIILLKQKDGERSMPIFVGLPEGVSLAAPLADDTFPRPTTADLTIELLRATGGSIERIAITSIRENTFYALISVNGAVVDSRPSDAINLAVRTAAPILLEEHLIEEYGLGGLTPEEKLEQEAARKGLEIPSGDWKSLSMELLRSERDEMDDGSAAVNPVGRRARGVKSPPSVAARGRRHPGEPRSWRDGSFRLGRVGRSSSSDAVRHASDVWLDTNLKGVEK